MRIVMNKNIRTVETVASKTPSPLVGGELIQLYNYVTMSWIFLCVLIPSITYSQDTISGRLPDVLKLNNGQIVSNAQQWIKQRKPEILRIFKEEVYGRSPEAPSALAFSLLETKNNLFNGLASRKQIRIFFDGKNGTYFMDLVIYYPEKIKKPVPVIVGYNFAGNQSISPDADIIITHRWIPSKTNGAVNNKATNSTRGIASADWPLEKILQKGYAIATINAGDVAPDDEAGFKTGVQSLFPELQDRSDNFGTIAAWAWGLSRAADYFEKDPLIDPKKIIVFGSSRMGKAALWAGATDERFAITISNESGAGGAKLFHHIGGENTKNLCKRFPYWFCKNFLKFNGRDTLLPFDQHMLIALIAPRPVYIASAKGSNITDSYGEFLSAKYADPVYKLLNTNGLLIDQFPTVNTPSFGRIGYHLRKGNHGINSYDWQQFLEYADVQLNEKEKERFGGTTL